MDTLIHNLPPRVKQCLDEPYSPSACSPLFDLYPSLPYLPALWIAMTPYQPRLEVMKTMRTYQQIAKGLSSLFRSMSRITSPDHPLDRQPDILYDTSLGVTVSMLSIPSPPPLESLDYLSRLSTNIRDAYMHLSFIPQGHRLPLYQTRIPGLLHPQGSPLHMPAYPIMYKQLQAIPNLIYGIIYHHYIRFRSGVAISRSTHRSRRPLPPGLCFWIQKNLRNLLQDLKDNVDSLSLNLRILHDEVNPIKPHPHLQEIFDEALILLSTTDPTTLPPYPSYVAAKPPRVSVVLEPQDFTKFLFPSLEWGPLGKVDPSKAIRCLLRLTGTLVFWLHDRLERDRRNGRITFFDSETTKDPQGKLQDGHLREETPIRRNTPEHPAKGTGHDPSYSSEQAHDWEREWDNWISLSTAVDGV